MKSNVRIIELLHSILQAKYPNRIELIEEFQDIIWSDKNIQNELLNDILSELAYDLDFYEPREEWRKESPSYYGDCKLEKVIHFAIQKIQEHDQ